MSIMMAETGMFGEWGRVDDITVIAASQPSIMLKWSCKILSMQAMCMMCFLNRCKKNKMKH